MAYVHDYDVETKLNQDSNVFFYAILSDSFMNCVRTYPTNKEPQNRQEAIFYKIIQKQILTGSPLIRFKRGNS
jgi:hypothetical protein